MKRRNIVGITGGSGSKYGVRLLEVLGTAMKVTHLSLSVSAAQTLVAETDHRVSRVKSLADHVHNHKNIDASIASGLSLQADRLQRVVGPAGANAEPPKLS